MNVSTLIRPAGLPPITLDSVDDATRRQFMGIIGTAGLGITLGGCADDPTAGDVGTTRTVTDARGNDVEIPVSPERIVAADAFTLQALDELGAPLVAAATYPDGSRTGVSVASMRLPSIGWWELDLEAVVAAKPDLIVGITEWHEENYEQLAKIAPTVLLSYNNAPDWQTNYLSMADAAGLAGKARARLAGVVRRVDDLGRRVAKAWPDGLTVTVLRIRSLTEIEVYGSRPKNITSIGLLTEIEGLTFAGEEIIPEGEVKTDVAQERLRDVDADVIFYFIGGGDDTGVDVGALEKSLSSNPLWRSLEAVRNRRAFAGDQAAWFNAADVAGAEAVLDDLFAHLTRRTSPNPA
jgi:iron complex transport system substrate-binding protein